MKKILVLSLCLFVFSSCNKEETQPDLSAYDLKQDLRKLLIAHTDLATITDLTENNPLVEHVRDKKARSGFDLAPSSQLTLKSNPNLMGIITPTSHQSATMSVYEKSFDKKWLKVGQMYMRTKYVINDQNGAFLLYNPAGNQTLELIITNGHISFRGIGSWLGEINNCMIETAEQAAKHVILVAITVVAPWEILGGAALACSIVTLTR